MKLLNCSHLNLLKQHNVGTARKLQVLQQAGNLEASQPIDINCQEAEPEAPRGYVCFHHRRLPPAEIDRCTGG